MEKRICVICGNAFECYPSDNKLTCSPACRQARRCQVHKTPRKQVWTSESRKAASERAAKSGVLKSGTAAAQKNAENQKGEQNRNAKVWILKDPSGNLHYAKNMLEYARKNYTLFEPLSTDREASAKRIASGFRAIATSMRGTRKARPSMTYKGWTLEQIPTEQNRR